MCNYYKLNINMHTYICVICKIITKYSSKARKFNNIAHFYLKYIHCVKLSRYKFKYFNYKI